MREVRSVVILIIPGALLGVVCAGLALGTGEGGLASAQQRICCGVASVLAFCVGGLGIRRLVRCHETRPDGSAVADHDSPAAVVEPVPCSPSTPDGRLSETDAKSTPRFSWPMRIFLFVLLFDVIFRTPSALVPWEEWAEKLDMAVMPERLPTRVEMAELAQRTPTKSNPAPLRNRILHTLDSMWDFIRPWPSSAARAKIGSWQDVGAFAYCWLCSRLEFAKECCGVNEGTWSMYAPTVSNEFSMARFKLLFEDGTQQTIRLSSDPPDLTRYSHWSTAKILYSEVEVRDSPHHRPGYCNLLAHRYPKNERDSPLRAILVYIVEYHLPPPRDDPVEFLRAQNGPPLNQVGPVFFVYDVKTRKGEEVTGWPDRDSSIRWALGALANVPLDLD